MTLLAPSMLWSLVVLVPLVAIYFLKVRPRRKPTTAYFLWDQIFKEKRSSSLFQSLRDVWSLLLMILAAAAIALALARPEFSDERRDLLIVVDTSASMGAREGGGMRLDAAKNAARDIVHGLNGNQRASIATLDRQLEFATHLTENPRELLQAIGRIAVSPTALDVAAAPGADPDDLVTSAQRVIFISDGAYPPESAPKKTEFIKVGRQSDNIGLVAADLAALGGNSGRLGLYFQVLSTFDEPREAELTLTHLGDDGQRQILKLIPLEVRPGLNPPETFTLDKAPLGRWEARLNLDDDFAMDNVAYLAVAPARPVKVAVASDERYFFENSVLAFSDRAGILQLIDKNASFSAADVVLAKSNVPSAPYSIVFQPQGESPWWSELGDEVVPGPAQVLVEDHPVLRHLDAATIPFIGARLITSPPGSQVLVADDRGTPLIYLARQNNQAVVVVNLDPVASDFYFSAWFPVLVHSAATHLAARETPLAASYQPGETVPIPGGRDDLVTKVSPPPDPHVQAGPADASTVVEITGPEFHDIDRLGFYTLDNAAGKNDVGASLLSREESQIKNTEAVDRLDPISRGRPPAHWLTLLAIVILTGESILYYRRKVG